MTFRWKIHPVRLWRGLCSAAASAKESLPVTNNRNPNYLYTGISNNPYTVEPDLDFRHRFKDLASLKRLLELRESDYTQATGDLDSLSERYHDWYRRSMDLARTYPRERVKALRASTDCKEWKEYRRALAEAEEVERETVWACLRLPAGLHPWTPVGKDSVQLASFRRGQETADCIDVDHHSSASHMEILGPLRNDSPLIEFKHYPPQCFLLGSAARLLRALEQYCVHTLCASGYRLVSPAHFIRTAMIEALYGDPHNSSTNSPYYLPIKSIYGDKGYDYTWALNLAGHGPLAYLALFTRKILGHTNPFPLKFVSSGMSYRGAIDSSETLAIGDWNLFTFPTQRPRITMWTVFNGESDLEISNALSNIVQTLLSNLKLSFTIGQQPSSKLLMSEMSRVDFHAATPQVQFASISNYGDFLSRRIRLVARSIADPTISQSQELKENYAKCCYAEIDLYNVLARIYEEMHPEGESRVANQIPDNTEWWPPCLRASD